MYFSQKDEEQEENNGIGIGTMIAACLYGSDTDRGNRTGEVICHGVVQLLTSWIIFGWVWAILEAVRYFEYGVCC